MMRNLSDSLTLVRPISETTSKKMPIKSQIMYFVSSVLTKMAIIAVEKQSNQTTRMSNSLMDITNGLIAIRSTD